MCAKEEPPKPGVDDVWGDESDDAPAERSQLDREWEARHQQFYNTGYREGLDEGKELTLQLGFNAGFSEGAQAGFEFGAAKGVLQTLAAMYTGPPESMSKIQELLQQVNALANRTVMRDSCIAILQQPVAGATADDLQQALQQLQLDDDLQPPDVSAAVSSSPLEAGSSSSGSGEQHQELPLPQQLVVHIRQELLKLGFDVATAPVKQPVVVMQDSAAPPAVAAGSQGGESSQSLGSC